MIPAITEQQSRVTLSNSTMPLSRDQYAAVDDLLAVGGGADRRTSGADGSMTTMSICSRTPMDWAAHAVLDATAEPPRSYNFAVARRDDQLASVAPRVADFRW